VEQLPKPLLSYSGFVHIITEEGAKVNKQVTK